MAIFNDRLLTNSGRPPSSGCPNVVAKIITKKIKEKTIVRKETNFLIPTVIKNLGPLLVKNLTSLQKSRNTIKIQIEIKMRKIRPIGQPSMKKPATHGAIKPATILKTARRATIRTDINQEILDIDNSIILTNGNKENPYQE